MSVEYPRAQPVTISLADLQSADRLEALYPELERAFGDGPDVLGILVVKDLPSEFSSMRKRVLAHASRLGALPDHLLHELERQESKYLVGWSCGQETFRGKPDLLKGSFYFNPTHPEGAHKKPEGFPEYQTANVWPDNLTADETARLDELRDMRADCERLGRFMVEVGVLVARACDHYVRSVFVGGGYDKSYLEDMVRRSSTCKARLLHYFPTRPQGNDSTAGEAEALDSWCGEHLDHGCLTALTSAMYVDDSAVVAGQLNASLEELAGPPDARSGLYIRDRSDRISKVGIPRDCLAFQTGEALQITTRGKLRAVPHFVVGNRLPTATLNGELQQGVQSNVDATKVSRNTLAVFMQPNLDDVLGPASTTESEAAPTFAQFARGVVDRNYGIAT
ncbi:hypothetical protein PYCC9005_003001 [Savitreella phatthalungensis]